MNRTLIKSKTLIINGLTYNVIHLGKKGKAETVQLINTTEKSNDYYNLALINTHDADPFHIFIDRFNRNVATVKIKGNTIDDVELKNIISIIEGDIKTRKEVEDRQEAERKANVAFKELYGFSISDLCVLNTYRSNYLSGISKHGLYFNIYTKVNYYKLVCDTGNLLAEPRMDQQSKNRTLVGNVGPITDKPTDAQLKSISTLLSVYEDFLTKDAVNKDSDELNKHTYTFDKIKGISPLVATSKYSIKSK